MANARIEKLVTKLVAKVSKEQDHLYGEIADLQKEIENLREKSRQLDNTLAQLDLDELSRLKLITDTDMDTLIAHTETMDATTYSDFLASIEDAHDRWVGEDSHA
jgi:hypothetical protein